MIFFPFFVSGTLCIYFHNIKIHLTSLLNPRHTIDLKGVKGCIKSDLYKFLGRSRLYTCIVIQKSRPYIPARQAQQKSSEKTNFTELIFHILQSSTKQKKHSRYKSLHR